MAQVQETGQEVQRTISCQLQKFTLAYTGRTSISVSRSMTFVVPSMLIVAYMKITPVIRGPSNARSIHSCRLPDVHQAALPLALPLALKIASLAPSHLSLAPALPSNSL